MYYDQKLGQLYDYGTGVDPYSLDFTDPFAGTGGAGDFIGGGDPLYTNIQDYAVSDTSNIPVDTATSGIYQDPNTGMYVDINTGAYVDPTTGAPLVDMTTAPTPTDPNFTDYGDGTSDYFDTTTNSNTFYDSNTGETTVTNADGSGQYTDANGNVTTWDAAGNSSTSFADGGQLDQAPDGSAKYTDPNGAVSITDANGNLLSYVDPNAGYAYTVDTKTGLWTENYADGSSCSGDFSGNYCCSDGTCTPAWQDKATDKSKSQPMGSAGSGGAPKGASGQQKAQQAQQAAQAALQRLTPTTAAQLRAQQAALAAARGQGALQPAAQGINIGGTTISWTWLVIGGLALLLLTRRR